MEHENVFFFFFLKHTTVRELPKDAVSHVTQYGLDKKLQ